MHTDSNPWPAVVASVGTVAELTRRLNSALPEAQQLSPQAVHKWASQVPAERVLLVERISGVSRHALRPDVFGAPPEKGRRSTDEVRPQ